MTTLLASLNVTPTRRWTVVGGFVLAIGLLLYHGALVLLELPSSRGSYPYYLVISKTVRDLPIFEARDEPRYVQAIGDVGPAHESVYFCSTATPERIFDFYSERFAKLGFAFDSRSDSGVRFAKGRQAIGVGLMPELGCWRVDLWFIEG